MKLERNGRGFPILRHEAYLPPHGPERLVSCSSAIGDYDDSFARPGTSFLWVGDAHHLDREQAAELGRRLLAWAETGSLCLPGEELPPYAPEEESR